MCVEGASTLQQVLLEHQNKKVKVFVVWEPVLPTDIAPPSDQNLARIKDARARQFWDQDLLVSNEFMALANANPDKLSEEDKRALAKRNLVWDFVAVFPPGAHWEKQLPFPDYFGGPVVEVTEPLSQRLSALP